MKVAALFVEVGGPYWLMGDKIDFWDIDRDARLYRGPWPVIAHPPCGRWCGMARMNEKRWGAKVGDDGGCFESALTSVHRWGGVLEHPAFSLAWSAFGLERPINHGWNRISRTEWVGEVWQSAYGHKAMKRTWLYYVGCCKPDEFDKSRARGSHQIGGGINTGNRLLPRLDQSETHITPKRFADYLINLAANSRSLVIPSQ